MIENGDNHADKSDEEGPFHDSDSEAEESLDKIKQKAKKIRVCWRFLVVFTFGFVLVVQYTVYFHVL